MMPIEDSQPEVSNELQLNPALGKLLKIIAFIAGLLAYGSAYGILSDAGDNPYDASGVSIIYGVVNGVVLYYWLNAACSSPRTWVKRILISALMGCLWQVSRMAIISLFDIPLSFTIDHWVSHAIAGAVQGVIIAVAFIGLRAAKHTLVHLHKTQALTERKPMLLIAGLCLLLAGIAYFVWKQNAYAPKPVASIHTSVDKTYKTAIPWRMISASPVYQQLSYSERVKVIDQYFIEHVAPRTTPETIDEVWQDFYQYTLPSLEGASE